MSSYIYFFLRSEDCFIPLGTWTRNSKFYEVFQEAPCEKISMLSFSRISAVWNDIAENIENIKKKITNKEKVIKEIALFNNDITEKMEVIKEIREDIEYYEELNKQYEEVISFLKTLTIILGEMEDRDLNINCIYYGIECYEPTVKDIQE